MPTTSRGTLDELPDAALVARAAQGDPAAFDALFRRYYERAVNLARQMGDGRDAEDIAQAAFVRAYGSIGSLRDGQAFAKWMCRIVVNLVRDRAKSARRKPWLFLREVVQRQKGTDTEDHRCLIDPAPEPGAVVTRAMRDNAVRQAIAALPADFREVVVLHHLHEMDVADVARTLGIAEGTVKSRLGRARARLRSALGQWLEWEDEDGIRPTNL